MYEFLVLEEWPWWFGGSMMGLFVVLYAYVYNRTVGMSSMLENAVRDPLGPRNLEAQTAQDAALEAIREMGLSSEELLEMGISQEEIDALQNESSGAGQSVSGFELQPLPFLAAALVGALIVGLVRGNEFSVGLGVEFAQYFTTPLWATSILLFVGGLLGGFGARMAGGCPSGHGLAGLSLFSPGSLVALCAYFATGVSVSFVMEWLQ